MVYCISVSERLIIGVTLELTCCIQWATWLRFNYVQRNLNLISHQLCVSRIDVNNFVLHNESSCNFMNG